MVDVVQQSVDRGHIEAFGTFPDQLVHLECRLPRPPTVPGADRIGLGFEPMAQSLVLMSEVLIEEDGIEVDPDHAAVLRDRSELVIRQVSRVVRQRPAGRV